MLKLLVVDDTRSVHAFIKRLLLGVADLATDHVANGVEALGALEAGKRYDLVLLDWEMPEMDGPSTLARIRASHGLPVVMMSTKNEPEDIARMLEAGVTDYIMKPFTLDILAEKIANATGKELRHAA